jgi:hypothetical protein
MGNLLSYLADYFEEKKCNMIHEYPNKMEVVDFVGDEGEFIRIFYCLKCETYRWKEIKKEKWTIEALFDLRAHKYKINPVLEELSVFIQEKRKNKNLKTRITSPFL